MITIADWDGITRNGDQVEFVNYDRIMEHEMLLILYGVKEKITNMVKKRLRSSYNER